MPVETSTVFVGLGPAAWLSHTAARTAKQANDGTLSG